MSLSDDLRTTKVREFLDRAAETDDITMEEKVGLQMLLEEPEPKGASAVAELFGQCKGLFARLGVTRRTATGGEAGKIDNLLVLVHAFAVLFCVAALTPCFFIYLDGTWFLPFLLFCPAVHFIAFRLARNPAIDPELPRGLHLFAALASIVPAFCLVVYLAPYIGSVADRPVLLAAPVAAWVAYMIVAAALLRTENAFLYTLFFIALLGNLAFFLYRDIAGNAALNLLFATHLCYLAARARDGGWAFDPRRLGLWAGVFLGLAFAALFAVPRFIAGGTLPSPVIAAIPYAAALILLPPLMRREAAGLDRKSLKISAMLLYPITWLHFGVVLWLGWALGGRGIAGDGVASDAAADVALAITFALAVAWTLWVVYRHFRAGNDFDDTVFGAAGLLLCAELFAAYVFLAAYVGYTAALALAVGVFVVTRKAMRWHEERADDRVDAETVTWNRKS